MKTVFTRQILRCSWSLLWLLVIPLAIGIVDSIVVEYSWSLAYRKQFRYDPERPVSSWIEGGEERPYSYADWQAENDLPD